MLIALLFSLPLLAAPLPAAQSGPEEAYQFLVGLSEKGMDDLVLKEATAFLSNYPRHAKAPAARYRLALALFDLERKGEAAPHFQRLAHTDGFEFRAEAALRYGQCLLAGGDAGGAATAFADVLGLGSDYLEVPATFLLAEARFRSGAFAEAEEGYLEVLAAAGGEEFARDALYGAAWCAYRLQHAALAVERAREFERLFPEDPLVGELRFLAGEAALGAGDARAALADYARVESGPFAAAALRGAGFAAAALGEHAAAADWFGRLLGEHPDSPYRAEAALQRGIHLLQVDRVEEALPLLAGDLPGTGAEALYWRGVAQARHAEPEAALGSFEAALRAQPGEELAGRIHAARGDALYELGRLDEAAASYARAESDYALHAAVVAQLNEGRAEQAVELAERMLASYPESAYAGRVRLALGEALLRLERFEEAETAFAAALAGAADEEAQARATSRLGWCRYLSQDPAGAAPRFAQVAEQFPASAEAEEACYMEGRALMESGDEGGARRAWTRYLERHAAGGRVSEVMFRLGRMDAGAEGLERFEALLASHADSAEAPKALYELGERLYEQGELAAAEEKFSAFLGAWPRHPLAPAAGYALAWCQFDGERPQEAADLLPQVIEAAAAAGDADLRRSCFELLVWARQRAGDAAGAREAFLAFAGTDPEPAVFAAAARVAAKALAASGDPAAGLALLGQARERLDDAALAAGLEVERCYLALDAADLDAAQHAALAALALAPDDPAAAEAAFFAAEARFDAGDDAPAIALYAQAAAVPGCPVADRALYKQGYALLRADRPADAAPVFAALVDAHPDSVLLGEGLFLLGESCFRLGHYEEAVPAFARLRAELPQHEAMDRNLFRLGVAQCQLEDWEAAASTLAELARRFPEFANGTEGELWRGRALAAGDDRRGARQAFERVLARDQSVLAARARLGLGKLELAAEQVDAALSEFLKVAVLYGHSDEVAEGLYYAGLCLERLGDPDRAADQYREILKEYAATAYAAQAGERLKKLESAPR